MVNSNLNSGLIPLEAIRIASPCKAEWSKMVGDDKVRFCGSCAKNVYNLAAMSRNEAEQLVTDKQGDLCVQLFARTDGTVITSDCPIGTSPVRRSGNWVEKGFIAAIAALLGAMGIQAFKTREVVTFGGGAVAITTMVEPVPLP
ncbi:hypothetical protein EON80_02550 [bacterium]|nr:MAG: hypothetical protein EON80_02550 [bacterium]